MRENITKFHINILFHYTFGVAQLLKDDSAISNWPNRIKINVYFAKIGNIRKLKI